MIEKILCVCKGNSDRSPFMAAVLKMYLGENIICESAGILKITKKGGNASHFMVLAAKRINIDLSGHDKKWVDDVINNDYDLIVCVDEATSDYVMKLGVDRRKVYNAQIFNRWPSQFQSDYDDLAGLILQKMYEVIVRYF